MTELPTTFGKYFLTDKLAIGGMAEIFLAKLIGPGGFEKAMVIKQIHPALSSQRAFVDLFVAEAKTLVSLSQANIVPIYELGVVDETYFIAMEYVDGPTLWQLTEAVFARGDAVAPAIAAHIAAEIARGLDYAHRKGAGVIHRDLSPRNVMLTRDGEVKLVDFGIAVALGEGTDAAEGGLPTGSFPYMSPEQAARSPLTGQTDLFSLGVLCWEMLTGRRLFAHDSAEATLEAVARAPIARPSSLRPVPARLDAIVMRALERDPAARWATAAELGAALQRFLADETDLQGGRDLAALVARVCPPTVGPTTAAAQDAPATQHDAPPPDVGPSTLVVPRSQPRGKRRATVREATFATHVELERVMGPVTPAMGDRAARVDDERTPTAPVERTEPVARGGGGAGDRAGPDSGGGDAPTGEYLPPTGEYLQPTVPFTKEPGPETTLRTVAPPRADRRWLAVAVLIAIAATAFLLTRGGGQGRARAPDAASGPPDATALAPVDAALMPAVDAALAAAIDAAAPDAPTPDAPTPDAPARDPLPPRDARPTAPLPDARPTAPPPDASTTPTGRLRVGADPWGEVFLDGKPLGRAPNAWTVPAGPHTVEVVFPGDGQEQRRRFDVHVPPGGTHAILADFNTP